MNVIDALQDVMSQVPLLVQPLIVAIAAAIPFVEGELASVLGVWAGLHPVVAGLAAVTGNFLSVLVVVVFGARIRAAVLSRRARKASVAVSAAASSSSSSSSEEIDAAEKPESKGVQRFKRFLVRLASPVPAFSVRSPCPRSSPRECSCRWGCRKAGSCSGRPSRSACGRH